VNERIGYMTQSAALYEDLTLRDNLIFFGRLYGMRARDARRRATELAELTTLGAKLSTQVRDLSGGQRQLANLSCAMVHQPKLLLLDEPTVGVDPVLRRSLWRHFGELNAEGTTMLVTTHVMEEAEHCHRVAMISAGRAIALGTPEELRRTAGAATLEEAYLAFSDGSGRPEEEAT
jgi:ABC-2 type transport system ATP-binding protein